MIIRRFILFLFKVNFFKTVYINFKTQKFFDAIKFPILVFGPLEVYSLQGRVFISDPIKTGMILIGKDLDHNPVSNGPVRLNIIGDVTFNGPALISGGSVITVWSGLISFGRYVSIGSGVQVKCAQNITIGDNSQVVALSVLMDTDVHYMKDIATGKISNNKADIKIGMNCWLNQGTIVSKGTVLPDYSVTARNSFLNKNYSLTCTSNTLYAGAPAKPIKSNVQRIFSFEKEKQLNLAFLEKEATDYLLEDLGLFDEPMDKPHIFKL